MKQLLIKKMVGLCLLIAVIVINLISAFNFYSLDKVPISDFFYFQANKNELFNPQKRY